MRNRDQNRQKRARPGAKAPDTDAPEAAPPAGEHVRPAPGRRLRTISRRPDSSQVLAGIPDAVTSYDESWCYVYVNQKATEFIGRSAEDLLGRCVWEIFPDSASTLTYREFHRAMAEQCSITFESYSPPLERWFEHRLFPSPHGLTVWSRDVSERRAAEIERARLLRALTESEERFRALIEHSRDGIVMTDPSGTLIYVSPSAAQAGGWQQDETRGRSFLAAVHPDDRERLLADRRRLLDTPGAVVSGEYRFPHRNGTWLWVEMVEQNLLHHPSVGAIVTNFRDVTARKNAERNLETLLEVARAIGDTLDLTTLLEQVQRDMAGALGCDLVATFRWDEDAGLFRVASHFGCPAELAAELSALTFPPFAPFGGRLAEGPVVLDETSERSEPVARLCAHFGLRALLVAPLRLRGRQLGAIAAMQRTPGRRFERWQVELCAGIARQLAVALERLETQRLEHEMATVSAALAQLGRQLLTWFDQPKRLDQICERTACALGSRTCVTFLWRPEAGAFMAAGSYGLAPARAEEIRVLGAPRGWIPDVLRRLEHEDVVEQANLARADRRTIPAQLRPKPGTNLLFMALRRGSDLIGFQVATQDPPERPFSTAQLQIARGAAQRVSMALEHARVLEQLERANRLKSDFVAMMSHELRTPLHVLLGYGDLLLDGAFGELGHDVLDVLGRMQRSSRELLQLVDEVLDLTRLESERVPLNLTEISPHALLDEMAARAADLQRSPEVALRFECAPDLPPILTDAAKVGAILKNLIGNALKFTSRGEVKVTAAVYDGGLALTVRDTGIGIAPEQQAFIFDPFRQGDSTMTRRHGGVGLGLYIVRRVVDLLGGRISLDSEPGRGSTFSVWIPDDRRPLVEETTRFASVLATTNGEAAIVSSDGTIIAVNDRWLRFASDNAMPHTDRLGVGANYFAVCAAVSDRDVPVARSAGAGLRSVLDGTRDHFALDYSCIAPHGRWAYRMQVSSLGPRSRYALVSHTRRAPDEREPELSRT